MVAKIMVYDTWGNSIDGYDVNNVYVAEVVKLRKNWSEKTIERLAKSRFNYSGKMNIWNDYPMYEIYDDDMPIGRIEIWEDEKTPAYV